MILDPLSKTTQCGSTTGSYVKAAGLLLELGVPQFTPILDYGSGLGKGTKILESILVLNEIESYDPFADNVTYKNHEDINIKFSAVVCLNVLNVLRPLARDETACRLMDLVDEGGFLIVSTRGWKGDIANSRHMVCPVDDVGSAYIRKTEGLVYQKGFDGDELIDYFKEHDMGLEFNFKKIRGIGKSCILGRR